MHSIEELNKKIWYRLLKVLYILALMLVIGITLLVSWANAHTPDLAALARQYDGMPASFIP